ncbi:efflux RND transporter periplasmic adaptor subunit [Desulfofustis limnaeus]|jgi:HlyD family secretion protein|uniref:Hemolysin secretion protein D n=1 Tax=Desulfofustis limnaeus TaxID=2740163 RepID=A0ABN6M0B6_9BACT|nr:efflux RND transporter periplasmic adaptor subunit [Desulfofustis limnaeus]MDX9893953.1 efflux RND transporter periplasmic adaptor subunit [Desulfofustis sp.]BDD86332.1 hemolysin secretion protein D [Desulfofustis limnaeus]
MNAPDSSHADQAPDLQQLLQSQSRHSRRRWLWLAITALALAAIGIVLFRDGEQSVQTRYRTEPVVTDTLVVTVSATGNLQPTNQVDVGSELSGIISEVLVDSNDQVVKGQVLARLDLAKLDDAVARSRANLATAEAQVLQARATLSQARATMARMQHVAEMSAGKVPSHHELDSATADLARAEAAEAAAQAGVVQARASLQSDETDLAKATIRSPINGVVLSRQVEPGQTVAASFQAPVLFTLAEDLAKMELQVDVDEADVGRVREGQPALFTVDAWPGRRFTATITRVGYGAQEKDGVISYPAELEVDNSDLSLRPGMTATAEITTLTRENALLVPNAALRYMPPAVTSSPKASGPGVMGALLPRPPRSMTRPTPAKPVGAKPQVWVVQNGQPTALEIRSGATNGRLTEVLDGPLQEGMQVITETLAEAP